MVDKNAHDWNDDIDDAYNEMQDNAQDWKQKGGRATTRRTNDEDTEYKYDVWQDDEEE